MYSPGKSNYKKPPEKIDAAADLLPIAPAGGAAPMGGDGLPLLPDAGAVPAPIPGMLDAPPAIPGLPN